MRQFDTGSTRNDDTDNLDYEGFLSPIAIQMFAEYMHENQLQADGTMRSSDNWQKGIPTDSYMKSMFRHFFDVWLEHRGLQSREGMNKALSGLFFNVQGYMHEYGKQGKTESPQMTEIKKKAVRKTENDVEDMWVKLSDVRKALK